MICITCRRLVPLAAVLALSTAACSSLTQIDDIRVDKDSVIAALKTAEPTPPPPPPAAVAERRSPAAQMPGAARAPRKGG